jgi:hypothetical protein
LLKRVIPVLTLTVATLASSHGAFAGQASATGTGSIQAVNATYDAAVLADNPLFYWPLDETSGAVRDRAGHAAASTTTTARLGVPGAAGTAASFDGTSQRIQIPYTSTMRLSGSFSAEVWAKLPSSPQTTGWPTIFGRGEVGTGRFGYAMWVSSDTTHGIRFKRNGIDVGTKAGLTTTGYRHLVFTWDSGAKRWSWYVDGVLDNTGVHSGLSGVDNETGPMVLGAMLASGAAVNHGRLLLDGLALYGRALTGTQIAAHRAAATTTSPTPTPTPVPTIPAGKVGGVAVGALQPWNPRRAADYKALGAANATWVRSDLGWMYLEPVKGSWRFDQFDPVVADAKANGMRYLAILHTVPNWANGGAGDYGMPSDVSLVTNYCYQTARHYIPMGVTEYEIGNEINLPHPGWQNPSGAVYTQKFLAPCVSGLRRAATELNARPTIIFGSLAPTEWTGGTNQATFLTDAYNNGAQGLFDAMAWHPYTGADAPSVSVHMNADSAQLNSIMAARGDGAKKIWATEYGVPTGGPNSVSEQAQVTTLNGSFDVWYAKPFAGPLFWYSGRDSGTSTTDREQHFGVLRYDGSAKPAYAALAGQLTR